MTLFYLDTEFNDYQGELISIALVSQFEEYEFYAVIPCVSPMPWVAKHVMPQLYATSPVGLRGTVTGYREFVQKQLEAFLSDFDEIEIIADYPVDIAHFCDLLITGPGQRLNTIQVILFTMNCDLSSERSEFPHNALADARAIGRSAIGVG